MPLPENLEQHQPNFKPEAWRAYTLDELGHWVHLFAKRSEHRDSAEKRAKDLQDARNYWTLMGLVLDELEAEAKS